LIDNPTELIRDWLAVVDRMRGSDLNIESEAQLIYDLDQMITRARIFIRENPKITH